MILFFDVVVVTCDALSLPGDIQVYPTFCTNGRPLAGTHCSFFCTSGLGLTGNISSVFCGEQGSWNVELSELQTHCEGIFYINIYLDSFGFCL